MLTAEARSIARTLRLYDVFSPFYPHVALVAAASRGVGSAQRWGLAEAGGRR